MPKGTKSIKALMRKLAATRKMVKKLRGGGLGHTYTFGAPIIPNLDAGQTVVPQSSCMAADRFGTVPVPTTGLGLPGMSGGRRVSRGGRVGRVGRRGSRALRQRGGRYSFDLSAPAPGAAAPWAGGIPPVMRIPCESSSTTANVLNAVQRGGVGGIDSAFYAAPTAGYSNTPSSWVGSTGAPSLLQTPYEARTMNPACLKTGGARRGSRASRKGRKASRKGRKGGRKASRKASRR